MKISVKFTEDRICTCNSCFAQNYDSSSILNRRVDVLYDVQIGCMLNRLCVDCLEHLIEQASIAIEPEI